MLYRIWTYHVIPRDRLYKRTWHVMRGVLIKNGKHVTFSNDIQNKLQNFQGLPKINALPNPSLELRAEENFQC